MNYYFIDYENVRMEGIKDFKGVEKGDVILFFYSENCKNITLDVLSTMEDLKLKFHCFKTKTGTKNALDFQLSSILGYVIGLDKVKDINANYYIVSDDRGFEVVADFWREEDVCVSCVSLKETSPVPEKGVEKSTQKAEPIKKKSAVASKDLATLEEITKLVGKNNDSEEILKIFNQYKSKQAISNGIAKYFKDNKKTSDIYKKLKPLLKSKNKS